MKLKLLGILADEDFPVKTYSLTTAELSLNKLRSEKEVHTYHPDIEKKIRDLAGLYTKQDRGAPFCVEVFLDAMFQNRVVEFGEGLVERTVNRFDRRLEEQFIRMEQTQLAKSPAKKFQIKKPEFAEMILNGCTNIQKGAPVGRENFTSQMLSDCYSWAMDSTDPLKFLSSIYLAHILKLAPGRAGASAASGLSEASNAVLEETIRGYVDKVYHKGMFKIDVYNDRFVFIELFYYVRCGLFDLSVSFVRKHEGFFKEICRNFSALFFNWSNALGFSSAETEQSPSDKLASESEEDDPFKVFFYRLFSGKGDPPKSVVSTIEDYLWYQLLLNKTITKMSLDRPILRSAELFSLFAGSVSSPKLLLVAVVLGQWRMALDILHDESFSTGEVLFLSYSIVKNIKRSSKQAFPGKRTDSGSVKECLSTFIKILQGVSSLFLLVTEKLLIIQIASSFIDPEWLEDLVAEAFISSEDFALLGSIDASGRKAAPTLTEHVGVEVPHVISKVSKYYEESGDLEKALRVSFLSNSEKTQEILNKILMRRIKNRDFDTSGFQSIVEYFRGSRMTQLLWTVLRIGRGEPNMLLLIRSTGLVPSNEMQSILQKAEDVKELVPEVREIVPHSLAVISSKLACVSGEEAKEMARALLQLCGVLALERALLEEITESLCSLI